MSLALALLAASTGSVAQIPEIRLDSRAIRAGDLAEIPGREQVIVGTMPRGENRVEVEPEQARRLIANRLPGARFALRYSAKIALTAPAAAAGAVAGTCFKARADIAAGSLILTEDLADADCADGKVSRALGYDHARRAPAAKGRIAAGDFLGPIRASGSEPIAKGKLLKFRTSDGPVIVERDVEALQIGRPGRKMFVRTKDGKVIAAPLAAPETAPQTKSVQEPAE